MPTVGEAQLARLAPSHSPISPVGPSSKAVGAGASAGPSKGAIRLTGQMHTKPQACQSCQQRKRRVSVVLECRSEFSPKSKHAGGNTSAKTLD
jgi:hypothetical protein